MPVVPERQHAAAYKALFEGLHSTEGVKIYCKAKAPWESAAWIRAAVGTALEFEDVLDPPFKIDLPNMVFVSVSSGSSGLLEGLGRGIPAMIVRDF